MPPMTPADIGEMFSRAALLHQQGNLKEAAPLYARILSADPLHFDAHHMLGVLHAQQGRFVEAAKAIAQALKMRPRNERALSNYGNILKVLGHFDEALLSYDAALSLNGSASVTWYNRGLVLADMRRFEEAATSYDTALSFTPNYVEALQSRAAALCELRRFSEALSSASAAIRIRPDFPDAFHIQGIALWRLKRLNEALDSYNLALAIAPHSPGILNNRGMTLCDMERHDAALDSYNAAIVLQPDYIEAMNNRGIALASMRRYPEALESFDAALAIRVDYVDALSSKGAVLTAMERHDEALTCYAAVLKVRPANSNALYNSAVTLSHLGRFDEALTRFESVLSSAPAHPHARSGIAAAAQNLCDWDRTEALASEMAADIANGTSVISPFTLLGYGADPSLQLRCAQAYLRDNGAECHSVMLPTIAHQREKLRIAYVSSDFCDHPVAHQLVELLERHDRSAFTVHGVCLGVDDGSPIRARLINAFDRFHDVGRMSDRDVVARMHQLEIDIAIDLNGHTQNARPGIFARRAAPVQVNYLGYPATTGSGCMDYIIADRIAVPFEAQHAYSEAIVHLPDSFFVSDARRSVSAPPARRAAGLPESGFIFCNFNQNWKITAAMFDVWMRLLRDVPDSVLWLKDCAGMVRSHLRNQAQARGIDPDRLVFAGRADIDQHLARLQLADLFLDTLPYNAHATASDALWAGVPVVTCTGQAFAGRVASSLLSAIGMPELVTQTLADYEGLALRLARDPANLRSLRQKLAHNRLSAPLFDTDATRRSLEAAYQRMWKIARCGEPPASFGVTRIGEVLGPAGQMIC